MQVKKKKCIWRLCMPRNKSFRKGFMQASLRQIVKAAGTTIGNFYNYLKTRKPYSKLLLKRNTIILSILLSTMMRLNARIIYGRPRIFASGEVYWASL